MTEPRAAAPLHGDVTGADTVGYGGRPADDARPVSAQAEGRRAGSSRRSSEALREALALL